MFFLYFSLKKTTRIWFDSTGSNNSCRLISVSSLFLSANCCGEVLFPIWILPLGHVCLPGYQRWAALCLAQHHWDWEKKWLCPVWSHSTTCSFLPPIHSEGNRDRVPIRCVRFLQSAVVYFLTNGWYCCHLCLWLYSATACGTTRRSRCPISSRSWRRRWTRRKWWGQKRLPALRNLHVCWGSSPSRPPPPPYSAGKKQ